MEQQRHLRITRAYTDMYSIMEHRKKYIKKKKLFPSCNQTDASRLRCEKELAETSLSECSVHTPFTSFNQLFLLRCSLHSNGIT